MARLKRQIVIVGGGLTGLPLALALREEGVEATVLEARPEGEVSAAGRRVLALALGSVQFLERLGIRSHLEEPPFPIREIVISDKGHFGKARLRAEEVGLEAFGYTLTAANLERALSERARAAGIELFRPVEVVDFRGDFDVAQLLLSDGRRLEAELVVAADGDRSRLRQLAGVGISFRDYRQVALISTLESEVVQEGLAFERFTTEGPLALLPIASRRFALIWTRPKERVEEELSLSKEAFEEALQEAFGWRLGRLEELGPRVTFPLKQVVARRLFGERLVLVGNAAHRLHPVAGQGLNLGLRDALVLAQEIGRGRAQGLSPGSRTLLERYAARRLRDQEEVVRFCDGLVLAFTSELFPLTLARSLGLWLFDRLPPLKSRFVRRAAGISF